MNYNSKRQKRILRHNRVRSKVHGTAKQPRIAVFRSNKYIYAQAFDDENSSTIAGFGSKALSSQANEVKSDEAFRVGQELAGILKEAGVKKAFFDRGGFKYHGRVMQVAEGLRKAGIEI